MNMFGPFIDLAVVSCVTLPTLSACASGDPKGAPAKETGVSCTLPQSDEELRKLLSPEQYRVVRENGTEQPFRNAYWDEKRPGIYVDVVSGVPLFSSTSKFDSGTGWPSFTQPIRLDAVKGLEDTSHGMKRVEVRSASANSHLGHVFDDGPGPTGARYCINSASLRFIPAEKLSGEGYQDYLYLFPEAVKKAGHDGAVLAGGCFWGMEEYFRQIDGIVNTLVGYSGGTTVNPTYKQVCTGKTGHAEAMWIEFDPAVLSYRDLLRHFFRIHNPTSLNRQGNDIGTQYRSAIFTLDEAQKTAADALVQALDASGTYRSRIVTEVSSFQAFYPAEAYHQDYLTNHPGGYCHIDLGLAKVPLSEKSTTSH